MIPIYKLVDWVEEYKELWDNFADWIMPPYFDTDPTRIHMMKMYSAYNVMLSPYEVNTIDYALQFYCIDPNVKCIDSNNLDIITWFLLNYNPHGFKILEKHPENINWSPLSKNPAAIHMIENNLENVDWKMLSANPAAGHILETHENNIDWLALSANPGTIHILKHNIDNIYWPLLCENPAVYELDTAAMRQQMQPIAQELTERVYHPNRVQRIMDQFGYDILEEVYVTLHVRPI